MLTIAPTNKAFVGCSVAPELPAGLTMDADACVISGRPSAIVTNQVFTVTSTIPNHGSFTGSFTLTVTECNGNIFAGKRVYKGNSKYETFTIMDAATQQVLYEEAANSVQVDNTEKEFRVCTTASRVQISLSGVNMNWNTESVLYAGSISNGFTSYIYRLTYFTTLNLDTEYFIFLDWPVPIASSWYYKSGTVPTNWYDSSMSGWTEYAMGQYPDSTNRIQLYKKTFTVSSLSSITGIALNLHYH